MLVNMLRQCRTSMFTTQLRPVLLNSTPKNVFFNKNLGALRMCARSAILRPANKQVLKLGNSIRTHMIPVHRFLTSGPPTKQKKTIGYWLLTCSGMVFVAVVLGGVTRLTESGLSMVTWKLLGEKLPSTEQEWEEEFRKYQQYPEFKIKNREITLSEFKWIWYMEYGHRMWGRAIGAVFLVPALYFWSRGRFTPSMKKRVVAFGTLIAAQGLMGWYMVKSGLEDRFHGDSDVPRVSRYRLAAHLSMAFLLYTLFLWSALDHLLPDLTCHSGLMGWYMVKSGLEDRFHGDSDVPRVSRYRLAAHLSMAFLLYTLFLWSALDHLLPDLTCHSGLMGWYMVKSGLEDRFHGDSDVPRVSQYRLAAHLSMAFLLYTLFLWSALDHLLPAETMAGASLGGHVIKSTRKFRMLAHTCKGVVFLTAVSGAFVAGLDAGLVYNSFPKMADRWIPDDISAMTPRLVNVTENPTTVQFNHRVLGVTTVTLVTCLYLMSRRRVLPRRAYTAAAVFATVAWLQVALGISTLLTYVPTALAATHQSGSLLLLSTAIWLTHELKKVPK